MPHRPQNRRVRPLLRCRIATVLGMKQPSTPVLVSDRGALGRSRDHYRTKAWRSPTHGVRLRASAEPTLRSDAAAVAAALPAAAAFCLGTAAQLLGLPVPYRLAAAKGLHVALPPGTGQPTRRPIRLHRVALVAADVTEVDGVRVTSGARTFVDLAAVLALDELVAVGDAALRRAVMTTEEIGDAVRRRKGNRGIVRARRGAALLDPRAASPRESQLRVLIVEDRLPIPVPNAVIRDDGGGFLAVGDLVFAQWKVVVEYDGHHHDDPRRREADATRRALLQQHGWYIVEITASDLRYPARALAKIRAALQSRGALL